MGKQNKCSTKLTNRNESTMSAEMNHMVSEILKIQTQRNK